MPNVLFVCTANRCRSPMAERLFIRQLEIHFESLEDWKVSSTATWGVDGIPPNEHLIVAMDAFGIDIRNHKSRILTEGILERQDLVLVMEANHQEALHFEFPKYKKRILMISQMIDQTFDIPDPFSQPLKEYERVAQLLDSILIDGFKKICQLANEPK